MNGKSFAGEWGVGMKIEFRPCDFGDLTKIISSIGSKSAGLNYVNQMIIRSILVYIFPVLVHLITFSIEKGVFPKLLKTATILPLYKGGTQINISN